MKDIQREVETLTMEQRSLVNEREPDETLTEEEEEDPMEERCTGTERGLRGAAPMRRGREGSHRDERNAPQP